MTGGETVCGVKARCDATLASSFDITDPATYTITLDVADAAALVAYVERCEAETARLRAAVEAARVPLQTLRWMIEEGGHNSITLREGCLMVDGILAAALTPDAAP